MIFFDRCCVIFIILIMIKLYYLFNVKEKKKYFIICLGFFLLLMMFECLVFLVEKFLERLVKSNDKVIYMVDFMGWYFYIII